MLVERIKKINRGHVLVMCIGNIFIGMGSAIFKLSGLGNDPFSGMVMALSDYTGLGTLVGAFGSNRLFSSLR